MNKFVTAAGAVAAGYAAINYAVTFVVLRLRKFGAKIDAEIRADMNRW